MEEATGRQGIPGSEAVSLDSRVRDSNQEELKIRSRRPPGPEQWTTRPQQTLMQLGKPTAGGRV